MINHRLKKHRFKNIAVKILGHVNAASMKIKRKKQTFVYFLPGGFALKMRLLPWIKNKDYCQWLISLAVSKSTRQINDWLKERKNKRTKKLNANLTGVFGPKAQAIAVRQMRYWTNIVPRGDILFFRCESALPEKQFKIWSRWFQRHESKDWIINSEFKYFLYCS